MTIKTWPYGGKPSIAVAKETKSSLLTVWPIELWGAVTPATRERQRGKVREKWIRARNNRRPPLGLCSDFPEMDMKVMVIPHRRGCNFNMVFVCRQRGVGGGNELFVLATEPWIFNKSLNQLGMTIAFQQPILFLWQPTLWRRLLLSTSHLLLLGDNEFYFFHIFMHHIADFLDFLWLIHRLLILKGTWFPPPFLYSPLSPGFI